MWSLGIPFIRQIIFNTYYIEALGVKNIKVNKVQLIPGLVEHLDQWRK